MRWALVLGIMGVGCSAVFQNEGARFNNEAVQAMEGERFTKALELLTRTSATLGESFEVQMNLSALFIGQKEAEKSLKAASDAVLLSGEDPQRLAMSLTNRGVARALLGEVDEAAQDLQAALDAARASGGEELVQRIKQNIELLFDQSKGGKGQSGDSTENQDQDSQKGDEEDQNKKDDPDREYDNPEKDPKKKDQKEREKNEEQLSDKDVKRIFEELKQQEDKIRRDFDQQQRRRDYDREKNW